MGMKDAPCEHPSPAKTSAPAPSTFIFPRRRSHFPRMAFGDAHEDFGPPQQQLSTMGYPRKSYPHRCSPPCAKRSRPRACARVYIIYRSPVGRSRECPRRCGEEVAPLWPRVPRRRAQGGGGRRQRRTPPRAATRTCPPTAEPLPLVCRITVRKGGSAQGNPRVSPPTAEPLPAYGRSAERRVGEDEGKGGRPFAQSPALSLPTAPYLPAYVRITVRKGGSAQGNPRSCPSVFPASARLPPAPAR